MPEYTKEIERERLMNLLRATGWDLVKEEMLGNELHMTIKKEVLEAGKMPGVEEPT